MNEELIKILEAAKLVLWDGKDHVFLYDQTKLKYACWAISSVVTDGVDTYGRCVPLALQNLVNDHIGANETMLTYLYDVKCGYIKATELSEEDIQSYRFKLIDSMISELKGEGRDEFFNQTEE